VADEETVSSHTETSSSDSGTSNVDVVLAVSDALERGDALALMGHVSRDIVWTNGSPDSDAVPWFGVYRGKAALLDLFAALATATFTGVTRRAVAADGDVVMVWLDVELTAPTGRTVRMEEVQVFELAGGRITGVHVLSDTAALAAAFA